MPKKALVDEIRDFQQNKKVAIPIILSLGVLGLLLPILPGVALLFLGFLLLFPRDGEKAIKKIRDKIDRYLKRGN
ncbi:MAG: hypothetical protein ACE5G1_03345 [bacterium]